MDNNAQLRGARLREERKRLGWTQHDASKKAAIRREMWARYEAGAEPGAEVLAAIAIAGADVLYILIGERVAATSLDEHVLLALFRTAPLTLKAAAIGALRSGTRALSEETAAAKSNSGEKTSDIEAEESLVDAENPCGTLFL